VDHHDPEAAVVDWARRVNRSWIVHHQLHEHSESWLDHLTALDDGRLLVSCESAKRMCRMKLQDEDPKPWFYAGLFHLATVPEATRFLSNHPITRAAVPSLHHSPEVVLWLENVGSDTRKLIARLRQSVNDIS
jgi:hypothetical protein